MATRTTSDRQRANNLKLHRAISTLDLETTGTIVEIDRIVEIGILKVLPDGTERRYSQRVNPEIKIPKEATAIHGITGADAANGFSRRGSTEGSGFETSRRNTQIIWNGSPGFPKSPTTRRN